MRIVKNRFPLRMPNAVKITGRSEQFNQDDKSALRLLSAVASQV